MALVLLILGAGPNIGAGVARAFSSNGYKIALAARHLKDETGPDGQLHVHVDLTEPGSVASVFKKVSTKLGPPAVVVYNAATFVPVPPDNPLELSLADYQRDNNVNVASALLAAKEAVKAFEKLSSSSPRTFIYTGNIMNSEPFIPLLSLGLGKSAAAHLVHAAALAYKDRGYKFYYADERKEDGSVAGMEISGDGHGEFYLDLAGGKEQGPWLATFVKSKGYTDFSGSSKAKL